MVLVWGHLAVWDQLSMEHQKRCYEDLDLLMRVGLCFFLLSSLQEKIGAQSHLLAYKRINIVNFSK